MNRKQKVHSLTGRITQDRVYEAFDLVLLDVMMPRLSGYEVCRALRQKHPLEKKPPVIFLTAKNQDSDVVTGMALGANDYLTKPISKDRLLARVRPHLDLLQVHRNLEDLVAEKMSQIKVLRGLLPICAGCKKIRDDEGYWNHLEVFIGSHSEAGFSHSICPDCIERYYAEHPELKPQENIVKVKEGLLDRRWRSGLLIGSRRGSGRTGKLSRQRNLLRNYPCLRLSCVR